MTHLRSFIRTLILLAGMAAGTAAHAQFNFGLGRPDEYVSTARVEVLDPVSPSLSTVDVIQSPDMHRMAVDRMAALNPEIKPQKVAIHAVHEPKLLPQHEGYSVYQIAVKSGDVKHAQIYLNALLDEFVSYAAQRGNPVRSAAFGRQVDLEACQKKTVKAREALAQARTGSNSLDVEIEIKRLSERLIQLRNRRDDLRLEQKSDAGNAKVELKLQAVEQELEGLAPALKSLNEASLVLQDATKALAHAEADESKARQQLQEAEMAARKVKQEARIILRASFGVEVIR